MFNPFKNLFPKRIVGIDIGTASIKIVELSRWGKKQTLENYGEIKSSFVPKGPSSDEKTISNGVVNNYLAMSVREILSQAKIKTKAAIFSIPDFSTFYTSFDIPPMPEKEISPAIYYNASQYITLPISEVTLDWRLIPTAASSSNSLMKVFIVAIPNQVIEDYKAIAKDAGLELYALEAEVFSITKALVKNIKKAVCLVDLGVQSSTVSIIDQGFLKRSYSFNFNGEELTKILSSELKVGYQQAEEIKNKEGLNSLKPEVVKVLSPLIDPVVNEIKNVSAEFFQSEKKKIDQVYLTGGTAHLPGLKEYLAENLNQEVLVPNCFSEFLYPVILRDTLKEMSGRFSAAVGVALDGLEI